MRVEALVHRPAPAPGSPVIGHNGREVGHVVTVGDSPNPDLALLTLDVDDDVLEAAPEGALLTMGFKIAGE